MTLSPEDIQSKQFHVRFRGFDVEEVDGFLEQVAESFLTLIEENAGLKERIEEMTRDLGAFKQDEVTFKNAILSAQKVADEMIKKSRGDANRMLTQAKNEVNLLRDEANREIAALESRVDQLRGMQGKLMADLREVLSGYLEQLDSPDLNVPAPVQSSRAMAAPEAATAMAKPVPAPAAPKGEEAPLYEKITVDDGEPWLAGDDVELAAQQEDEYLEPGVGNGLDMAELGDDEPRVTIPAMDDDLMFSLDDDPLDKEAAKRRR